MPSQRVGLRDCSRKGSTIGNTRRKRTPSAYAAMASALMGVYSYGLYRP